MSHPNAKKVTMYLVGNHIGKLSNMVIMDTTTMRHNKRGNIIGFSFAIISFLFIWAIWLGSYLNELGDQYISQNTPDIIEIYFYSNLNLFVFFGLVLAIFIYFSLGSGGQG